MLAVTLMRGAGHVVEYQSQLSLILFGLAVGIPAREAWCDPLGRFVPFFDLMDDVYATGISLSVDFTHGTIWVMRDESGVATCYQPATSRSLPAPLVAPVLLVPAG